MISNSFCTRLLLLCNTISCNLCGFCNFESMKCFESGYDRRPAKTFDTTDIHMSKHFKQGRVSMFSIPLAVFFLTFCPT